MIQTYLITPIDLVQRILSRHLPDYRVTSEVSYNQSYGMPQKTEYLTICRGRELVAYVFRGYSDPNIFHFVANRHHYGTRIYIWDILHTGIYEIERIRWWLETDEGMVDIYTV